MAFFGARQRPAAHCLSFPPHCDARVRHLTSQAYKQEPKRELGRLFNHLGVREPTQDEWQAMLKADAANQHSSKLRMREDTRQLLLKTFAPFNKALFDAVPELDPSLWQSS